MDQTTTGASLVSGIQDISAFLPIIGTEQCEKHVGEALQKGFLYAAATPLSMFGSLGIVKASAAILVASISPRFAQMLADAGFRLEGSVAAMIGATPQKNSQRCTSKDAKVKTNNSRRKRNSDEEDDIPQHLASRKFQELLDEQHINKSQLTLVFDYYSWNWQLCISTGLLACLSITPYIPLILDDHHSSRSFPAWAFPLMRIVGSAVSVVIAQMIMQVQMQRILQLTSDEAAQPITSKTPLRDAEKGPVADASHQNCSKRGDKMNEALPLPIVFSRPHLIFLQVLIFIGMVSTTVGYLGCFTVVQTARPNHTYIWLGVEIALALLRILIWGHNPHWDEPEGITLELSLPADVQKAPTITTSQDYMRYILGVGAGSENGRRDPFVILPDSRFLEYISPYTGPVEQFNDPDNRVAIYYTLAASSYADKALLTTVLDLESRSTFVLIHHCPFQEPSDCDSNDGLDVYSGTIEIMPDRGIMTAKCSNREYKFRERFDAIAEHSQEIANRIGGIDRVSRLRVSWTLELIDFPKPELDEPVNHSAQLSQSALTNLDKEYLRLQRLAYLWRRDFDQERQLHTLECMSSAFDFDLPIERYAETLRSFANALEDLLNYECAFFEKHLMAKTMPVDAVDHIFNQYARRLEVRVTGEARKEARAQRFEKYRAIGDAAGANDIFPDNMPERMPVAMDIDHDTLQWLTDRCTDLNARRHLPPVLATICTREMEQTEARLTMWKNYTSSNDGFAEAVFASYPSACDTELFDIMAARECTVFDIAYGSSTSLASLNKINNVPGVSLLRCPAQGLSQLTALAQSNPNILAIDVPNSVASEIQTTLQERRRKWSIDTPIVGPTGVDSFFCFAAGFKATGLSMDMDFSGPNNPDHSAQSIGFLLVKTGHAGQLQVNFWHRGGYEGNKLSWSLRTVGNMFHGSMEVPQRRKSRDFRRDSFSVEVPSAGVYEINISITTRRHGSRYGIRKVWVTLDTQDTLMGGDGRSLADSQRQVPAQSLLGSKSPDPRDGTGVEDECKSGEEGDNINSERKQ